VVSKKNFYILLFSLSVSNKQGSIFASLVCSNTYKASELFMLALVIPCIIFFLKLAPYIILILWAITMYTIAVYTFSDDKVELKASFDGAILLWVCVRWMVCVVLLLALTYQLFPDKLFLIQSNRPGLIWKILILYPILSALPQEFVFCRFFFHRYRCFFGEGIVMVAMSAVAFCIAHILFLNWVAPILGLIAGYLFANTYRKTGSLAMVTLEHSLYGNALFAIGLGWFFWGGSVA